jgi:peptidyl-tRNA hydrolase, PTH1 family
LAAAAAALIAASCQTLTMAFPLRLIVGLGNPGPEHAHTRHNAGFWFADALASEYSDSAPSGKWSLRRFVHGSSPFRKEGRFQGERARIRIGGQDIELFKPLTFMNRSGLAIRSLADFLKIPPAEILVAHDELDLAVGTLRLKFGGGAGGHNGLKDTIAHLGDGFWRFRFGIAHPGSRDEVVDYVLQRAPREEEEAIVETVGEAVEILPLLLVEGAEKAMNRLHRKKPGQAGESSTET